VGNYVGWAFMGWKLEPYKGKYDELTKNPEHRHHSAQPVEVASR
jgi:hypothetical protein